MTSSPSFPYSTKPNSLRKFLEQVPRKPRPNKVNADTLKAWDLKDNNDQTIIRVLKALELVGTNNEPTEKYTEFMTPGKGPGVLGQAVKQVWGALFELSHEPHKEDEGTLRNYFNIHSGGSEATIGHQIQTFKAACDFADFSAAAVGNASRTQPSMGVSPAGVGGSGAGNNAVIHIDLHIHLPENKSRRDYEYMFEDIAKYIYGRGSIGTSNE
ncbi:MAG: DUF5343 domain-containing protein [gamma proteobacterium symbiont of Clathrolucina costata]|uniref:DUF5343 domain-containing protein n=1 Tax=Candidatus Thiodiazotropha taylori TaxID=2792791 RepID=A0A9E4NPI9_9GAMM|nr:DUF5343 domain-containing protein [Candidatus Thiodiazotropha taylori]MCW4239194.1 DUF5343 domain-containing protein [Candidatus Thiodiazotropha endolucinida]